MRVLWTWSGVAALAVGVFMWGLIFFSCIHFRKKNDELPRQTKYNLPLEIAYTIFPFVIIAGLFYRTVVVENDVNKLTPNPDVRIQVDAFKWNWQFEYHSYKDAAGVVHETSYPGQTAVSDIEGDDPNTTCDEAASDSSAACDANEPAKGGPNQPLYLSTVGSDSEIPILVIPVHRTVRIVEHSADVVHAFWVPDFLFKRDVIPYGSTSTARDNQFEFTATSTGSFVGRCAELCGTYHSQMNFEVRVVDEDVFEKYMAALLKIGPDDPARQSKALIAAGVKGGGYATTTTPFDTSRTSRKASQDEEGS